MQKIDDKTLIKENKNCCSKKKKPSQIDIEVSRPEKRGKGKKIDQSGVKLACEKLC